MSGGSANSGPPAFEAGARVATSMISQTAYVRSRPHREQAQWWAGVFSGLMGAALADIGMEAVDTIVAVLARDAPDVHRSGQQ
jgi:hypothetical protein